MLLKQWSINELLHEINDKTFLECAISVSTPRKVFIFLPYNLLQRNGNVWRYSKSPHLTSKDHLRVWHKEDEKEKWKKGKYICASFAITFHFMKYATLAISKCFEFYNFLFKTHVHIIYTLPIMLVRWKTSLEVFWLNREERVLQKSIKTK